MDTNEQRRQKIATVVKWGLGIAAAVVISPVIFLAVKGLIGLAIAGVIGLGIIHFAPVIAMKFANWKVKAIVHEARENPIETLLNQLKDKQDALTRFKDSITTFRTQVSNFEEKVVGFKAQYPEEAPKFEGQLQGMKKLLTFRQDKYKIAKKEVEGFGMAIDRARALWDMSQEAQKMNKYATLQTGDPFEQIKTDVALESVITSVNTAFSELETALMDSDEPQQVTHLQPKALEHIPANVIDVTPVTVKERTYA